MRKNFLLLFLMALLPLAGWAQVDFPVSAEITGLSTYTFSGEDQKATILAAVKVMDGSENLSAAADIKIYTDEACTSVAAKVIDAGTYYVGAYGDGASYFTSSLVKKEFEVGKKEITVTAGAVSVMYGDLIDNEDIAVTYAGWGTGSDGTATKLDGSVTGTVTFTSNYVAGTTAVGAASIVVTPVVTGLQAKNYSFTPATGAVTVTARTFKESFISLSATSVTYNAANQRPTITVKENGEDIAASNYTIVWKDPDDTEIDAADYEDPAKFKDAGTYTLTVTGKGNYAATDVVKTFEINKKTLGIKTKTITKTYDGSTVAPAANATYLTFSGLEGDDAPAYAGLTVALGEGAKDGSVKGRDADVYPINVTGAPTDANIAKNYTTTLGSIGKLTINQKVITITANNAEKDYDNTADSDGYVAGQTATATGTDQTTAGTCKLDVALATGDVFATQPTLKRTAGENAGGYPLTPSGAVIKKSAEDVTKNYDIKYVPGTFTINAGGFTIWADDKTSVFGQETVELTATVTGIPAADAELIVYNEGAITTEAKSSSNRGTYTITIDKSKIDFSAIEGKYDINAVTVQPGDYVITPAPLKIRAKDQALQVGDAVKAASAETIEFVTEGVSEADKTAVIENVTLAFATTPAVPVSGDPKKLTDDAKTGGYDGTAATSDGVWVGGIVINADAYNGLATANYTLNHEVAAGAEAAAGTLRVAGTGEEITLDASKDSEDADYVPKKLAAYNGKKVVVKAILDRDQTVGGNNVKWNAKEWNTMVLPFDITVGELSTALGYAIVNVVKPEATTGDKVKFQLWMDEIPANTPFVVKTTDAIAKDEVINFGERIIDYNEAPSIDAGDGNTFHGAYAPVTINNEKQNLRFCAGTVWPHIEKAGSEFIVKPLNAYMEIGGADPAREITFEFEELDGTVTAIKSVAISTSDSKAKNAEGWYNLQGMKLQSAPTEKGVYIKDGKKYVVK